MAKHRRRQRVPPGATGPSPLRAVARPVAWSALITSVVLSVAVGPAHAAPVDDTTGQIPNSGVRPVPDTPLLLPGAAPAATAPALSPFAQLLIQKQTAMEQAGEKAKQAEQEHRTALGNLARADSNWRAAADRKAKAKERADADAAEAYKSAIGLPPEVASDLRGFGALSPVKKDGAPSLGSARELLNAERAEDAAYQAYLASIRTAQDKAQESLAAQADFKRKEADYLATRQKNIDKIAAAEAERERRDQALGRQYLDHGSLTGYAANPLAIKAVNVALKQLGKPYQWGAEGPNRFDCSGLMWYSYLHGPGYNLPRVAKDQYYRTRNKTVSRYALLPGDLLFFASNPNDWTTVHHVGMYLGNGRMIHAPHTGDVVKISTVWWSEFFAATRVYGEVVAPPAGGTTTPPSNGATTPPPSGGATKPPPSSGGTPLPSQTAKPPVSPSPSHSASPSPSDSPSPSPTSGSPSPTPAPTSSSPEPEESQSSTPDGGDAGSSGPATGASGPSASTEPSSAAAEETTPSPTASSGS